MTTTADRNAGMVQELMADMSDTMNDWEVKFVTSVDGKLDRGWPLTTHQQLKLEQIWAKVFP